MKRAFTVFLFLFTLLLVGFSQQPTRFTLTPNLKYEKPSKEELALTTYTPDTTAAAIMLYHKGKSEFSYRQNQFNLSTEHSVRIKILKQQGIEKANIIVPYYAPAGRAEDKDGVWSIEACALNMEDGKLVKTDMKQEFITRERVNENTMLLKFTIPAVKVGTIIEYKYACVTDFIADIPNWEMQEDIPVIYNEYSIVIPHIFIYNIELRGKEHIEVKEKSSVLHITQQNSYNSAAKSDFTLNAREINFISHDLPALKQDESFCWCPEDYKIQISFELEGTNYPGEKYKSFTQTWADIEKMMLRDEDASFGKHLYSLVNPFREELKLVNKADLSFEEKVANAFCLLKSKIAWNGRYMLQSKRLEEAKKKRSGSNADINFYFISMLKDLGIMAYPVALSRRTMGMLPVSFPSIHKLNTFVVAIKKEDNKYLYLDGSMDEPTFNTLPPVLLTERARILNPGITNEDDKWINLMRLSNNTSQVVINAAITENEIKGNWGAVYQGQEAATHERKIQEKGNPAEFVKDLENRGNYHIENFKSEQAGKLPYRVKETHNFTIPLDKTGDRIYVNSLIFPYMTQNQFIQSERILPIEFPYPYTYSQNVSFTIPDGYEVEEIPKSQNFMTENQELICNYQVNVFESRIMVNYTQKVQQFIFHPGQYKELQQMWNEMINKNKALIVLKKKI